MDVDPGEVSGTVRFIDPPVPDRWQEEPAVPVNPALQAEMNKSLLKEKLTVTVLPGLPLSGSAVAEILLSDGGGAEAGNDGTSLAKTAVPITA